MLLKSLLCFGRDSIGSPLQAAAEPEEVMLRSRIFCSDETVLLTVANKQLAEEHVPHDLPLG